LIFERLLAIARFGDICYRRLIAHESAPKKWPIPIDDSLATQALFLADGAEIHDVAGMVAVYQNLMREGRDACEFEQELLCFVVRKRIDKFHLPTFSQVRR
jgi:hypothetical protein